MAARVRLAVIPPVDEALRDLGTLASIDEEIRAIGMFVFVASHLLSTGGRHL